MADFSKGARKSLFGMPMQADLYAPVPQQTLEYKTPSTLQTIAGVIGDSLSNWSGGQGTFLPGQIMRQKAVLDARNAQAAEAQKFTGWKQQYDYELAHPKPTQSDDVFTRSLIQAGVQPGSPEWIAAHQRRAEVLASPQTTFVPNGDGGGDWRSQPVTPLFPQQGVPQKPVGKITPIGGASPSGSRTFPAPVVQGNIDIHNRPIVRNKDGSISTVRTISIGTDQGEVLIPTVVGGRVVSDEQAIKEYERSGRHLGIFRTPDEATAYAKSLHDQQEQEYLPQSKRLSSGDILPHLVQAESGGRVGIQGPQTPYGRAQGLTQVLPETGKAVAKQLGIPWRPDLMTGTSQTAAAYQRQIGQGYLEEALTKTGNVTDALRYYHGGPNRRLWGRKTNAYADRIVRKLGDM